MARKLQLPTAGGVTVRMYRHGHGDCYLLALPREGGGDPVYVLIDCGFKPGSPAFLAPDRKIQQVVDDIREVTGGTLDLVIVTHEHQDHLNGFWKKNQPYFGDFEIKEAWLAWTESPDDDLANQLRGLHHAQVRNLATVRNQLALAAGQDDPTVQRLDDLLELELGGEGDLPAADRLALAGALAFDPLDGGSANQQSLRLIKAKAGAHLGVRYLGPGDLAKVRESAGIRAFVLGPPRSLALLEDEDPVGKEQFPRAHPLSFLGAVDPETPTEKPFDPRYCLDPKQIGDEKIAAFFGKHYGKEGQGIDPRDGIEVPDDADWRRIDDEWLFAAESLALKLNQGVNNTSLVLAFELPQTKKILLFAGDAQRGNWLSWKDCTWQLDGQPLAAKDLLARTVLYKVGHHGSHNATLDGALDDDHPNLAWLGRGAAAGEFTALINAVNAWALQVKPKPWVHPLPSIRAALLRKSQGRVLQLDQGLPEKPANVPAEAWARFEKRVHVDPLYFDLQVEDV